MGSLKVLHAAFMPGPGPGALQQMSWEQEAGRQAGLDWRVRIVSLPGVFPESEIVETLAVPAADGLVGKFRLWRSVRQQFYAWLAEAAHEVDVILLRHSTSNPWQSRFIRQSSKPVFTVHHSSEEPELLSQGGLLSALKVVTERHYGRASLRAARGVIGLTPEILAYEQHRAGVGDRGIVWPNGVLYEHGDVSFADRREGDVPEVLFVASHFFNWHGLDLLLAQLSDSQENFRLHLVGNLDPADRERAQADERVVLHGHQNNDYIDALTERCWVGLSSFSLGRKGMAEACTLKVRQYLKAGLPVFSGHHDVFPEGFPYYECGEPEVAAILSYARRHRDTPRAQVSEAARPFIAKDRLVIQLHSTLEGLVPR